MEYVAAAIAVAGLLLKIFGGGGAPAIQINTNTNTAANNTAVNVATGPGSIFPAGTGTQLDDASGITDPDDPATVLNAIPMEDWLIIGAGALAVGVILKRAA